MDEDDFLDTYFDGPEVYPWPKPKKKKPTTSPKFKVGDIVRLKTGTSPIQVTSVSGSYISGRYVNSGQIAGTRREDNFVVHEEYGASASKGNYQVSETQIWVNTNNQNGDLNMNTLYQFKNGDTLSFGTYLATNSDGKWVMEDRSTKAVLLVDKADVEEVLPYTISVQFAGTDSAQTYSYLADKGQFDVGFYLVHSAVRSGFDIAQVTAVDTKSKKATKKFNPIGKLHVDLY